MKRARFTEEQIIGVLKEHEAGARTADLARKHRVSEATIYNWKVLWSAPCRQMAIGTKPRGLHQSIRPVRGA
jgi:transposase-like protein